MKILWGNSRLMWNEQDLIERDALVQQCVGLVRATWSAMNPAIKFARVETPIMTPSEKLQDHIRAGFPLVFSTDGLVLRPETTAGCVDAFHSLYPQESQRRKVLPFCVWQFGKSFRDESNADTMRATRLRLREFHQLEFELFASGSTKADYLTIALGALTERFDGVVTVPRERPHYSQRTLDWEINGVEVAGCSERTDWEEGVIYEVSIGIERLLVSVNPALRENF